jgi:hypothetical protein
MTRILRRVFGDLGRHWRARRWVDMSEHERFEALRKRR